MSTMITIQKLGDEHYHMTVTEDGYPLKYNFATNNYEYAELTEQGLVSSNIVAMPVGQRDARAKAYLQKLDKEVMMQLAEKQFSAAKVNALQSVAAKKSNANGPKRVKISDVPTTGKQKVLNILVEFSNCKFSMSDPKAYYDRFFHEKGFNENGSPRFCPRLLLRGIRPELRPGHRLLRSYPGIGHLSELCWQRGYGERIQDGPGGLQAPVSAGCGPLSV